jgi:integrase
VAEHGACGRVRLEGVLHGLAKDPLEVVAADVFEFLADQRGDRSVVRIADRESGVSARTIARRLSSISGLYAYLIGRGDTPVRTNPVPRGLATRRKGGTRQSRVVPLVRVPRTLPRILSPAEVDRLVAALRTARDRAMVAAMVLVGWRRCEVLGLRFDDVQVADRRLVIVAGKGGHHRVVPAANVVAVPAPAGRGGVSRPALLLVVRPARLIAPTRRCLGLRVTGSLTFTCRAFPNVLWLGMRISSSRRTGIGSSSIGVFTSS